jgi:glucosyl-3-phosphoglycerate synthase
MSDFAQHGPILTLPCLTTSSATELDREILPLLTQRTPVALVLPCIAADAVQAPLRQILTSLDNTRWLQHVLIPINGLTDPEFESVATGLLELYPRLPLSLLHTDADLPQLEPGKGTNVLNALRLLKHNAFNGVVTIHDADNLAFQKGELARLIHPVVDKNFGMEFAKQFYSRFDQRLHGRVSRLFLEPLLKTLHAILPADLSNFLNAFRYPLAGECALTMRLAEQVRIPAGWGLEIALLAEAHRILSPDSICQVGSIQSHQHRHHADQQHLIQQCRAILDTLAAHPATQNRLSTESLATLRTAFAQAQLRALRASSLIARANGLQDQTDTEFELAGRLASTLAELRNSVTFNGLSDL